MEYKLGNPSIGIFLRIRSQPKVNKIFVKHVYCMQIDLLIGNKKFRLINLRQKRPFFNALFDC